MVLQVLVLLVYYRKLTNPQKCTVHQLSEFQKEWIGWVGIVVLRNFHDLKSPVMKFERRWTESLYIYSSLRNTMVLDVFCVFYGTLKSIAQRVF